MATPTATKRYRMPSRPGVIVERRAYAPGCVRCYIFEDAKWRPLSGLTCSEYEDSGQIVPE